MSPTHTPSMHSSSQVGPVVEEVLPSVRPLSVLVLVSEVAEVALVVSVAEVSDVGIVVLPSLALALPEPVVPVSLPPEVGPLVGLVLDSLALPLALSLALSQPAESQAVSSPQEASVMPSTEAKAV